MSDVEYDARKQFQKNVQKQWLDEQIEEKRRKQEQERMEEQAYANQTHELNRMRGMLEDNFQNTKTNILGNVTEHNKRLDLERKQKEEAERQAKLQYQREEVEYLKQRGVKQNFP